MVLIPLKCIGRTDTFEVYWAYWYRWSVLGVLIPLKYLVLALLSLVVPSLYLHDTLNISWQYTTSVSAVVCSHKVSCECPNSVLGEPYQSLGGDTLTVSWWYPHRVLPLLSQKIVSTPRVSWRWPHSVLLKYNGICKFLQPWYHHNLGMQYIHLSSPMMCCIVDSIIVQMTTTVLKWIGVLTHHSPHAAFMAHSLWSNK